MCFAIAFGGAMAELVLAWVWLSPDYVVAYIGPQLGLAASQMDVSFANRLLGFFVSMAPLGVLFYALHQAYELFDAFRLGKLFTDDAPLRLRRIGMCMITLAVLRPLTGTLLGLVLTASQPPGQRILALGLSIDDYMIAVFGGLIVSIGHVMTEAKRLADENGEIV